MPGYFSDIERNYISVMVLM